MDFYILIVVFTLLIPGVQMTRKFLRERELMRTVFPEGMEEFQQLLFCEGKQKGTLLEASVRAQLFCNMVGSETGNPANAHLNKTESTNQEECYPRS